MKIELSKHTERNKMGFKNVLAFKFGDEGELIELDFDNIDEEFKSINALIFYIYNKKRLYYWVGRDAGFLIKKYMIRVEKELIETYKGITVLRHFTIEEGLEKPEFFYDTGLNESSYSVKIKEWNDYSESIYEQITRLETEKISEFLAGNYDKSIEIATEVIKLSEKVKNFEIIEKNEYFINGVNNNREALIAEEKLKQKIKTLAEELEEILETDEREKARKIADEIRLLYEEELKQDPTALHDELLKKEDYLYKDWILKQDEIDNNEKKINSEISKLEETLKKSLETKDFDEVEMIKSKLYQKSTETSIEATKNRAIQICIQADVKIKELENLIAIKEEIQSVIDEYTDKADIADYSKTISILDEKIVLAKENNLLEYADKLEQLKAKYNQELSAKEAIESARNDIQSVIDNYFDKTDNIDIYDEAITNLDNAIQKAESNNLSDYTEELEKIKSIFLGNKEEYDKKKALLARLINLVDENREGGRLKTAILNCEKLIHVASEIHEDETTQMYSNILNELKERIQEEEAEQEKENKRLMEQAKDLDALINSDSDVLPQMEEFSINDLIGDVSDDVDEMLNQLSNILDEHRVEIVEEITSKNILKSKSGEVIELEKVTNVVESTSDNDDKPKSVKYLVDSILENPFDDVLEEAIIQDLIPYNYEIEEMTINGEEVTDMPEKLLVKDGLEVTWTLNDIKPKESVKIEYGLRRRVSRTIILPLENQLKIIKTHTGLSPYKIEGLFRASLDFSNTYDKGFAGVVIEDIIPLLYIYNIKSPEEKPEDRTALENKGSLVKWIVNNVPLNYKNIYTYQLLDIYKFEDLKISINKKSNDLLNSLKNKEYVESQNDAVSIIDELTKYD